MRLVLLVIQHFLLKLKNFFYSYVVFVHLTFFVVVVSHVASFVKIVDLVIVA